MKPRVEECPECRGEAGTYQDDSDEDGARKVFVSCEWCDGCGSVAHCSRCDGSMPVTVAELSGYACANCFAAGEQADMADEILRLRRVG